MGVIEAARHCDGTKPMASHSLNRCVKVGASSNRADLSSLALIPSGPGELVLRSFMLISMLIWLKTGFGSGGQVDDLYAERSGGTTPSETLSKPSTRRLTRTGSSSAVCLSSRKSLTRPQLPGLLVLEISALATIAVAFDLRGMSQ